MKEYGLSDAEISKFQDPSNWLIYFPPVAKEDLKASGIGCDWRRSFVTADMNPFYDSFVRWQIRKLKEMGKIVKDLRYQVKVCGPEIITLIPPFPPKLGALEGKKRVYLAAATLRPETMYGNYGAYEITETDVFIFTERAALNLAYQNLSRVPQKPTCLVELVGQDLIGLPLRSPLSVNEFIYTLPMMNVLTDKGTGIVTSVPSDSPDDYIAMKDLKTKPALRAKYGVKDEWILPFEVVCVDLRIKSQHDKEKLAEAKRLTYLKGFTEGTMKVGEYGMGVQDAKPKIQSKLIENFQAVSYSEPEKKVMSRSGDECVVALADQWYITYGEEEWRKLAEECFWPNKWGCSRSFGLGTRIPFDEQFLVESLSDSTLYMAYYTIAHMLQNGKMYGRDASLVKPEQMTDEVWNYAFCEGPYLKSSTISQTVLYKMKQEFSYWYPFDLSLWEGFNSEPPDILHLQPHSSFTGTSLASWFSMQLNSEKMSKSTGNFKTLRQAIQDFSADATRFALAGVGDGMDDANFVYDTSTSAILRLTTEISWMEEILESESSLRPGPPATYADKVFSNEINIAVIETEKNFNAYMFRDTLKTGFCDLQAARDEYRFSCGINEMNCDLLWRFMDVQTRLITPICPHYAEYVWRTLLKKDTFVIKAGWPMQTVATMRKLVEKQLSGLTTTKKAAPVTVPSTENKPTIGLIYVNEHYNGWKAECLNILRANFDAESCQFSPDSEILAALKQSNFGQQANFKQVCMPFLKFKKNEALSVGEQALDLMLPFGEIEVLQENLELIKRHMGLEQVQVLNALNEDDVNKAEKPAILLRQTPPSPGSPTLIFSF
ncbi:hypothetical protein MKW94_019039 [Papaver nudicaule]|uniref:leucine--tRNA ligase n=1 Tax=Papaver nudicaule TaxID=74823 RepID=A0AA41V1T9_PAPNU|nr:hypothetical protein [Papaver nudicaule]